MRNLSETVTRTTLANSMRSRMLKDRMLSAVSPTLEAERQAIAEYEADELLRDKLFWLSCGIIIGALVGAMIVKGVL